MGARRDRPRERLAPQRAASDSSIDQILRYNFSQLISQGGGP